MGICVYVCMRAEDRLRTFLMKFLYLILAPRFIEKQKEVQPHTAGGGGAVNVIM